MSARTERERERERESECVHVHSKKANERARGKERVKVKKIFIRTYTCTFRMCVPTNCDVCYNCTAHQIHCERVYGGFFALFLFSAH